ncbi:serine hydrolase domain-containing protein [Levilactobacillus tongjiangensis]|uniref:Serine hydrolase domain-containing protein n=1 Tax=Levilactobacillus tongjiangensis TaxID=2486023 RepID=A0ABW1SSV6_9LACO|nr:serine hydrolase domain-containing protein [Levilactobacillus tongjiangensis]
MNKRNLIHWGVLLVIILGISGLVFGMHQIDTQDKKEIATSNRKSAKKIKRDIRSDARDSSRQRTHQVTAFDRRNTGRRTPIFTGKLTTALKDKKFSGTALVVKNDRVVYQRSFGMANAEKNQQNKATSQFLVNSIQKSMTGMLVMRAVQAGKISLTDKLHKYYPKIAGSDRVTLRQMLDMKAGLVGDVDPSTTLSEKGVYQYAGQLAKIDKQSINKFNYQPISFVLLAAIVNRVTGLSYYQNFYEHIVTPLDLNHTSFAQIRSTTKGMTMGYKGNIPGDYTTPVSTSMRDMEAQVATGNATMSAGDLFRAERAIIQGTLLATPSGANELHEANAADANYAGGMYHFEKRGYYGHGLGEFYEGTFVMSKNGRTGVIFLSNNFYKKTMWPDWSTEELAKTTFKHVLTAKKLN